LRPAKQKNREDGPLRGLQIEDALGRVLVFGSPGPGQVNFHGQVFGAQPFDCAVHGRFVELEQQYVRCLALLSFSYVLSRIVDQLLNATGVQQNSRGVVGGGTFEAVTGNTDATKKYAHTEIGSGNLNNLSQLASWADALYGRISKYTLPVSYQTGTYDTDLNSSKSGTN